MDLDGQPIIVHAVRGVLDVSAIEQVVVVAPSACLDEVTDLVGGDRVTVVAGGAERTDSVAAGLAALERLQPDLSVVLVHDAARCLTPVAVFERVLDAVEGGAAAAIPGVAVVDTIKVVDGSGRVVATPERSALRAVQTPQGFAADVLRRAHASGVGATDDAALVESLGLDVVVVPGDARALKITVPEDLMTARRMLRDGS